MTTRLEPVSAAQVIEIISAEIGKMPDEDRLKMRDEGMHYLIDTSRNISRAGIQMLDKLDKIAFDNQPAFWPELFKKAAPQRQMSFEK